MLHRIATTTLLLISLASCSSAESLRARSLQGNSNNPKDLFDNDSDEIIECEVHVAMHSPPPDRGQGQGQGRPDDLEEDGETAEDLLHGICNDGHLYELQGLDDAEVERVTSEVTADGGRGPSQLYAFPGAKKNKGGGPNKSNVLNIPARGPGKKYQAINMASDKSAAANSRHTRNLAIRQQGNSTVLLLRVKALDAETSHSHQNCAARTFGGYDTNGVYDDLNMVTRIRECSYSKLQFHPPPDSATYPGLINGTATIELNKTVIGVHHGTVLDWVWEAAPTFVGSLDQYDHVMIFMPPGVSMGGGAAWGYIGWKYTWYHDGYALAAGIQMHELGHNIGLSHSNYGGEYGDHSGYMGYGGWDIKMCYNGPKSHWLGWYEEYHQDLDPYTTPSKLVQFVGLADYDEAMAFGDPSSQAIVLKIDMYEGEPLYLAYNRAEKVNVDTKMFQDMITITRSNGPGSSWVEGSLIPGQKYHKEFIAGSGMVLEIAACDRVTGAPDTFSVSIHIVGVGEPTCISSEPIPFVQSWELAYGGGLTDSLVGYYTFDDNLLDSSGNDYHGSIGGGAVSYVDGPVGQALSLDGVDDFVALPNVGDLNFGVGDFTLTFWYRVSGDQSGRPAIITNKDWTSGLNSGWVVSSSYGPGSNGDDLSINLSDGTNQANANQAIDVAFNTWHFVVIRIKRGEKMSLLRSAGNAYALQEDTITSVSGSLDTGLPILIGGSHGYTGKTQMDMDDLGIWRRALSSEETEAIFNAGRDGKQLINSMDPFTNEKVPMPDTLIANYELESDIKDSSSNNLDLVMDDGGGVSFGTSPSGSFLTLDNINPPAKSTATVPETSLLDFASADFTISFWSRTTAPISGDPSIVANKNWQSGSNPGFTVGIGSNGRLEYNSGDGSSRCDYDGPAGTMTDGQWHFVALSQSLPTGQFSLYLDGKKVSQKDCGLQTLSSGYPIKVGGSWVYWAHYSGDVDKIMIHNSVLSHANVFELFSKGRDLTLTYSPTTSNYPTHSPTLRPTREPSPFPSKFPTSSPILCEGVYDDVLCCGSDSVKQSDYRGTISQTEGGIECQDWTSQSPHGHTRTPGYYPNSGLESNYCRNPDGEPRAWCYTTDPNVRWSYCNVPSCGTISTPPPTPAPITPAPTTPKPTTDTPTTDEPSPSPTDEPSPSPSKNPTNVPTPSPSNSPSKSPTPEPSLSPSAMPTDAPTPMPSDSPSNSPTPKPSLSPSQSPSDPPTPEPTESPTKSPTPQPTDSPTPKPTSDPTPQPTDAPTPQPTPLPTNVPTDNPTPSPTNVEFSPNPTEAAVCSGMDTSCCGSFWLGKRQNDYRGTISKTAGGIECQPWASQSPHGHNRTPQNYPNSGLDSNYCRNPDGEPRAWCYTSEPGTRWAYCDVPACESACAAGDADQCGCAEVKQADYRGTISTTISGKTCQAWSSQSPHSHTRTPENNPNSGLDSNYCRNPDGESQAWCYTTEAGTRWELCDVPVCGQ